jgi:hypothetical protein
MTEQERRGENERKAEEHAEDKDVPEGSTPEAVAEEEATGGALTNRGSGASESNADEAEEPPSPS